MAHTPNTYARLAAVGNIDFHILPITRAYRWVLGTTRPKKAPPAKIEADPETGNVDKPQQGKAKHTTTPEAKSENVCKITP